MRKVGRSCFALFVILCVVFGVSGLSHSKELVIIPVAGFDTDKMKDDAPRGGS